MFKSPAPTQKATGRHVPPIPQVLQEVGMKESLWFSGCQPSSRFCERPLSSESKAESLGVTKHSKSPHMGTCHTRTRAQRYTSAAWTLSILCPLLTTCLICISQLTILYDNHVLGCHTVLMCNYMSLLRTPCVSGQGEICVLCSLPWWDINLSLQTFSDEIQENKAMGKSSYST